MARSIHLRVSPRVESLPPYIFGRINSLKYELRRQGADVIDLGMGNPNDPAPAAVVEKLCEAVRDPRNHRYSDPQGLLNLRREVAKRYLERSGVKLDPEEEIICTIGSKEGISHLCLAILSHGDIVLCGSPAYPVHHYAPQLAGATLVTFPIADETSMLREIHDITQRLRPRPKLLILNFPHNPTTTTVEPAFFREVVRLARKFGLLVLHDFAYGATTFDGYQAPSFLSQPGAKQVGVEFTTMSKEFNMAGWRVGYCAGRREVIAALKRLKAYYDYGIFQAIQIASIIALRHCAADAVAQAAVYQRRRDVLCDGLERIGWPVQRPRASMFVWVPIPKPFRAEGSLDLALRLLREAQVAVAPGKAFGEEGEGFLRLSLVENELRLKQAVRQIGRRFGLSNLYRRK